MKNRGYSRLKCSCQVHPPVQQHNSERWLTNPLLRQSGHHFVVEPWMFGRRLPSPASPALSLFSKPPALLSHTWGRSLNQTCGVGMQFRNTNRPFCLKTPCAATSMSLFFNLDLGPLKASKPNTDTRSPTILAHGSCAAVAASNTLV